MNPRPPGPQPSALPAELHPPQKTSPNYQNLSNFSILFYIDLEVWFDYYPFRIKYFIKGSFIMNTFLIFVVRLILGLVFGIFLIRMFRPEWGIYHGVAAGLVLVALAYGMTFFRKKK